MKKNMKRWMASLLALALCLCCWGVNSARATDYTGCLSQHDPRWGSYNVNGGTISATGCGILSLINAVGYLTGRQMDVIDTALWAYRIGAFNPGGAEGTYRTAMYWRVESAYGAEYGITLDCDTTGEGYWEGAYSRRLKDHLLSGGVAVGHVYNHFIAIVGYDASTNQFHLYDSSAAAHRGTNYNNGDVWVTEAAFSRGTLDLDWFCLVSSVVRDEECPVISNVNFSDVSAAGYTVSCTVTDNNRVAKVSFPTWTVHNDQDDLPANFFGTQLGTQSGNTFSFRVNASAHNNEGGEYITHIYAFDRSGNQTVYHVDPVVVRNDDQKPVISDVRYSELSSSGYTVSCKVTDDWGVNSVSFPTWTVHNGQDDLAEQFLTTQLGIRDGDRFVFRVDTSDHNNETGAYITHIYATDCAGNRSSIEVDDPIQVMDDTEDPVISDAVIVEVTDTGYTVSCKVTDNWGLNSVTFPTWSEANSQDDVNRDYFPGQQGSKDGDIYTFQVNYSDYGDCRGLYHTQICATDCAGNQADVELTVMTDNEISLIADPLCDLEEDFVVDVADKTTVETLLTQFENEELEVVDCSGNVIVGQTTVGTGAKIRLYQNDELVDTATVVVPGDVDGNGIVDTTDYMRIKSALRDSFPIDDAQSKAADVDGNGMLSITDYMRVKAYFLGTYAIHPEE